VDIRSGSSGDGNCGLPLLFTALVMQEMSITSSSPMEETAYMLVGEAPWWDKELEWGNGGTLFRGDI
jgi:hypothetical protein